MHWGTQTPQARPFQPVAVECEQRNSRYRSAKNGSSLRGSARTEAA